MTKLLESEGKLITRDNQHYIRLDRNGIPTEVPLAQGLAEYAGSKEADAFVLPPAGGAGSVGGTGGQAPGAGQKVSGADVLARGLSELIK